MTLVVSNEDVARDCDMTVAIAAMERVFGLPGDAVGEPVRVDIPTGNGWLHLMAATIPGLGVFGCRR
jgi:hypothetical protein